VSPILLAVLLAAVPDTLPAVATGGMVSTAHPLATRVGVQVLERGGNAFDAAVAVAAALNVVEPMMSGMGGYGTILVYSAGVGRSRFLNASGRIPRGTKPEEFRAPTPGYMENRRGAKAVSTPGNVNAWAAMHGAYGRLPWRDLFEPAARLADEGFELDARAAGAVAQAFGEFPEHARRIYGRGGQPLAAGERLVQADLARSLRLVASEGPGAFHGGTLGQAVDRAMRQAGGFLRLSDLAGNEAEWWEPVGIAYRGHRVIVPPPPANSFPALVRLGLMSRFDVAALGHNTADYLHLYAEVTKHGFWTRLRWAGDPDVAPPPLDVILSPAHWDSVAATFDPARAKPFVPPFPPAAPDAHTTHFVVADRWGNVVSATQTLGNAFGARIMPEGTGIWLNNSLAYCTFEPAGNPMDAHPGRRKLSGDVPLFVLDAQGRPWLAVGTPGGHTIDQTIPQVVMNVLDFGMDIQAAIAAPRITFVEPDVLSVERTIPAGTRAELERRGHRVREAGGIGDVHGLTLEWGADGRPARFTGGADPRGAGTASGPTLPPDASPARSPLGRAPSAEARPPGSPPPS
jgi:gamma-glutamyltranspeptidase/glutathione hydrolase